MLSQITRSHFLCLSNIPSHTHTHTTARQILFIHSSVNGHLGFYVLAIVNGAAMNIGVQVSFQILSNLSYYMQLVANTVSSRR